MTARTDGSPFTERPDPDDGPQFEIGGEPAYTPPAAPAAPLRATSRALEESTPARSNAPRMPVVSVDERTVLAQLRAGEESAFAVLFERYYDKLCAFATILVRSQAEAEEVVEEVFVRVWELREQLEIRTSIKSYLYSATRNHALNHIRHIGTHQRYVEEAWQTGTVPGMGAPAADLDEALHVSELGRAIDAAIAQLPPRCREVFLLHRQHGLTYAEIAATMEIAPKTVENQLGRALKLLRAQLATYLEN